MKFYIIMTPLEKHTHQTHTQQKRINREKKRKENLESIGGQLVATGKKRSNKDKSSDLSISDSMMIYSIIVLSSNSLIFINEWSIFLVQLQFFVPLFLASKK